MASLHEFPAPAIVASGTPTLSAALAWRRQYLTAEIGTRCQNTAGLRLLCAGVNALREVEASLTTVEEAGGEIVVLEPSEARSAECTARSNVEVVHGAAWPNNRAEYGRFDFIYAPNLLSCLPDNQARRALVHLVAALKRGGSLLLSSFSPNLADSQYSVGQSQLRSEEQLSGLTDRIPDTSFTGQAVWRDPSDLLVFLEIHR